VRHTKEQSNGVNCKGAEQNSPKLHEAAGHGDRPTGTAAELINHLEPHNTVASVDSLIPSVTVLVASG
jgi:hypothetical protein